MNNRQKEQLNYRDKLKDWGKFKKFSIKKTYKNQSLENMIKSKDKNKENNFKKEYSLKILKFKLC